MLTEMKVENGEMGKGRSILDSSSGLHSYRSVLSPNQKNHIRNVNTTQRTSPDEDQALMKVKGGRGKI